MVLVGFVVACDAFAFEEGAVRSRSAHDLSCSRDKVAATSIGAHSWEADGCGQKATYTCIHGEGAGEGQWSCMRERQ